MLKCFGCCKSKKQEKKALETGAFRNSEVSSVKFENSLHNNQHEKPNKSLDHISQPEEHKIIRKDTRSKTHTQVIISHPLSTYVFPRMETGKF